MKKLTASFANIVAMLNDGHYHDGTTIGDKLKITRSAVWKAIKKLQAYAIKVDSIKGKGYALLEPLVLLNPKIIKQRIAAKKVDIEVFETIDSTNDYLRATLNGSDVKICLAEQQTQGKGRLHRQWHSPFGQNIYLSCQYSFQRDVSQLAGLSLVVSLAVAKTLETYGLPKSLAVKWPNDIMYDHKKLSGTLIEIQAESHGVCHAIIGIGLNVNMMQDEDNLILQDWTSLRKITASYIDRNEVCVLLIDNLINYLARFEKQGLATFINEWNDADCLKNKEISLKNGNKKIYGKAKGIDTLGNLILQASDGILQTFSSGDTTLMK
jgi:BirA family transcriptional regulator, biotin operon repressor / biotin---[acetyl-CoA-carboxylase] ligase